MTSISLEQFRLKFNKVSTYHELKPKAMYIHSCSKLTEVLPYPNRAKWVSKPNRELLHFTKIGTIQRYKTQVLKTLDTRVLVYAEQVQRNEAVKSIGSKHQALYKTPGLVRITKHRKRKNYRVLKLVNLREPACKALRLKL